MTALRRLAAVAALALAFLATPSFVSPISIAAAHAQSPFPVGNVWPLGDSKTDGVTDPPGSCGPRDPMYATITAWGGAFVGTLSGGADGNGGVLTPCPTTSIALLHDGHSGDHNLDITQGLPTWAAGISTPHFVLAHVGTNDLIAMANASPGFNMDRFYLQYDQMVQTALALESKTTTIWVFSNMDPMPALLNTVPTQFFHVNNYIGQEVKKYQRQGWNIYLMDAFGSCSMTPTLGGDYNAGGIHESKTPGYSKISNCYLHTMSTYQPRVAARRDRRRSLVRLHRHPARGL